MEHFVSTASFAIVIGSMILVFALIVVKTLAQQGALDKIGIGVLIEPRRVDDSYRIFVGRIQPNTPAANWLRLDDQIVAVDDVELVGSSERQVKKLSNKILGPEGSKVQLTINRCGVKLHYELTRARLRFQEIPVS